MKLAGRRFPGLSQHKVLSNDDDDDDDVDDNDNGDDVDDDEEDCDNTWDHIFNILW